MKKYLTPTNLLIAGFVLLILFIFVWPSIEGRYSRYISSKVAEKTAAIEKEASAAREAAALKEQETAKIAGQLSERDNDLRELAAGINQIQGRLSTAKKEKENALTAYEKAKLEAANIQITTADLCGRLSRLGYPCTDAR